MRAAVSRAATARVARISALRRALNSSTGSRMLALPAWVVAIISANLLPVAVLRSRMDENASFPPIEEMGFFGDQHKFSSWVYAVASGNMLFWISLSWSVFSRRRDGATLAGVLLLAFVCTFFPAWVRLFRRA